MPWNEIVRFLSDPTTYGSKGAVEVRETSMSWIFLTPERAYKLKKSIRRPPLDFTTLERRRHFCAEEMRLNARLARETYLRILPLRRTNAGLSLGGKGRVVDWIVEMVRLDEGAMMGSRIATSTLSKADVLRVSDCLAAFYEALPGERDAGETYVARLSQELALDRAVLAAPDLELPAAEAALKASASALERAAPAILKRAHAGCIVEGHGDLRPEHVWLGTPLQIIDCLEFDRGFRLLDPYDEVAYLGLECAQLGAPWVRPLLLERLAARLGHPAPTELIVCYTALRALTRARLCLVHLREQPVRTPARWRPEALRYLAEAEAACLSLRGR